MYKYLKNHNIIIQKPKEQYEQTTVYPPRVAEDHFKMLFVLKNLLVKM